jgi:indole-3-glycerol phosphate synthase
MILDEIMAHKRRELALKRRAVPLEELKARNADRPRPVDFEGALRAGGVRLIAEIKKASPSRGEFCPDLDPEQLAHIYSANGAAAISVLTDDRFFLGKLDHIPRIKSRLTASNFDGESAPGPGTNLPILRKDFIFDPYQIYESLAYGADALLLIAAVLSDAKMRELLVLTQDLGMTALVEVHDQLELERVLRMSPPVVGINNRNLEDFSVDLNTFGRLRPLLPDDITVVAESGVHTAADVIRLAAMDADAVLVGEALVTAPDVASKVQELASAGRSEAQRQRKDGGT